MAPADEENDDQLFADGSSEDYRQAEWLSQQPRIKDKWRYDHTAQKWHHWDRHRWALDDHQGINYEVALAVAKANKAGKGAAEAKKLLNLQPQKRALEALSTFPGYGTNGDDWDSDPFTLGVDNGIVNLKTNTLIPRPVSTILVTRSTGVKFTACESPAEFRERAPTFMRALDEWTSEDPTMVGFLLLWYGSSMFGFSPEQRFLLMTGIGRNGKGALKHAVLRAVGEYGAQFDANLYMRSKLGAARADAARADLVALKGRRITFFSEPEGNRFNEELLKAHTGGDQIVARALYSNNIQTWAPTHSITFLVNDAPEVEDLGPSMAARVMVADFRERFDGDKEDKTLYTKLEGEREGILAILCWAAAAWYRSWEETGTGITLPERVQEQSQQFMDRNDPIAAFLDEACTVGPDLKCHGQALYDAYKDWFDKADSDGERMSLVRFTTAVEKKGLRRYRASSSRGWLGVKPKSIMELAMEDDSEDDEE